MNHRHLALVTAVFAATFCRPARAERLGLTEPFVFSLSPAVPTADAAAGDNSAPIREKPRREETPGGALRLGVLAGVGAPGLLSVAVTGRISRYLGVGAQFGWIPEVKLAMYGEATLSYQQYDVFGRIYPAGGGFFLGTGVGYASIRASFRQSYDVPAISNVVAAQQVEMAQEGTVRSMVLTPQLGYMAELGAGFVLELALGAQIPIRASEVSLSTSVPSAVTTYAGQSVQQAETKVRDTLRRVGQQPLPTLGVRLGWLF